MKMFTNSNSMKNPSPKERHENLIKALNTAKRGTYKIKKEEIFSDEYERLNVNDINKGVGLFVDFNFMSGGSVGDYDLYRLLQEYFWNPDKREKINEIVRK